MNDFKVGDINLNSDGQLVMIIEDIKDKYKVKILHQLNSKALIENSHYYVEKYFANEAHENLSNKKQWKLLRILYE